MKEIVLSAKTAVNELVEKADLKKGQIVVIGCSTSEIVGSKIGTNSVPEVAAKVCEAILSLDSEKGIYLAAQCCEHLNRAIVIEEAAVQNLEVVNVVPQPKAGGSFATAAYNTFKNPVVVEEISANAGLDIGFTMIGMHIKRVAVPVRLKNNKIGNATVLAARSRPKFIGGQRACYNESLT